MSDTPTLNNLDQAQSQINEFISKDIANAKSQLSSLNNTNLNNVSNTVNGLVQNFEDLKQKIKDSFGSGVFTTLNDELESVRRKVSDVNETFNSVINTKTNVNEFVSSIGLIGRALEDVKQKTEQLNNVNLNSGQFDDFKGKVKDMTSLFDEMIQVINLDNVNINNYQQVEGQIKQFMERISSTIGDTFDIAKVLQSSMNGSELTEIVKVINTAFGTIPEEFKENCSTAFRELQNNNTLKINVDDTQFVEFVNALKERMQMPFTMNPVGENATMDAINSNNARYEQDRMNRINSADEARVGRIGQSQRQARALDGDFKDYQDFSENMETTLERLKSQIKNNNLDPKELNAVKKTGFDDTAKVDDILKDILEVQRQVNKYSSVKNGISNHANLYRDAVQKGDAGGAAKELEILSTQTKSAAESVAHITELFAKMASVNFDSNTFKDLPEDLQDFYQTLFTMSSKGKSSIEEIRKISETLDIVLEENIANSLKKTVEQISSIPEQINNSGGITQVMGELSNTIGKVGKAISGIEGTINALGLGVGLPLSMASGKAFVKGTTEYYKEFGEMEYQTARSLRGQGMENIDPKLLDMIKSTGIEYHANTYGKINYQDYASQFSSLVSNVGNHNGSGFSKEQGAADMADLARTGVDLKSAFGIEATPIIKTLYKELNLSTKEVNESLMNMVGSAQAANIPVKEYVETVTSLAMQYKAIGLHANDAENAIRNLTMSGFSLNISKEIAGGIGGAVGNLTDNTARAGYWGMRANPGQFSNAFEARRAMLSDMYDSKGNVKENGGQLALSALTTELDMIVRAAGGKNSDSGWSFAYDHMKNTLGIKDDGAAFSMTEAYASGDLTKLQDIYKDTMGNGNKSSEDMSREKLEKSIIDNSSHIDELTKASEDLKVVQMQLAKINNGLYDLLGKSFQSIIATLGGLIVKLNNTIASAISKLPSIMGGAMDRPVTALITAITGALGIKTAAGALGARGLGALTGNVALTQAGTAMGKNVLSQGIRSTAVKMGATAGSKFLTALPFGIGMVAGGALGAYEGYKNGEGWEGMLARGALGAGTGALAFVPGIGTAGALALSAGTNLIGNSLLDKAFDKGSNNVVLGNNYNQLSQSLDSQIPNFNGDYINSGEDYAATMYGLSGVNPNIYQPIKTTPAEQALYAAAGTNQSAESEQQQSRLEADNFKIQQGNLIENSNSLAKDSYNMQQAKYTDLITGSTDQLEILKTIANISDAGFTFLDKAMHKIYDKLIVMIELMKPVQDFGYQQTYGNSTSSVGVANVNTTPKVSTPATGILNNVLNDKNKLLNTTITNSSSKNNSSSKIKTAADIDDMLIGLSNTKTSSVPAPSKLVDSKPVKNILNDLLGDKNKLTGSTTTNQSIDEMVKKAFKQPAAEPEITVEPALTTYTSDYNSPLASNTVDTLENYRSPVYDFSNPYYSNNSQSFNAKKFSPNVVGSSGYITDAQGMSRGLVEDYSRAGENSYAQNLIQTNDRSASTNSSDYNNGKKSQPNFNINIKVENAKDKDYNEMAKDIQKAIENVIKDTMDAQVKIAESNYYRYNDD